MKINEFKQLISTQGLARSNRWLANIYPPPALTSLGNTVTNALTGTYEPLSNIRDVGGTDVGLITQALRLSSKEASRQIEDLVTNVNFVERNILGYTTVNNKSLLESLSLYCKGATLPGRDLTTVEWKEYGEARQLGTGHNNSDNFDLVYYCSEDLIEKLFFEQWQNLVFDPVTKKHGYYKDYISTIELIKYDAGWKNPTAIYKFYEAYPNNLGALELNHEEQSVLELTIGFNFRNYERIL